MGIVSNTKTKLFTTAFLGFMVALVGSPTWAETIPSASTSPVSPSLVSTESNQSLSVLRAKLKERFSGVAEEAVSLVNGTTSPSDSFHGAAVRTIDVRQGIGVNPEVFGQDYFVDIENDPYATYINRLAAYGVLSSSEKFYPQNYLRVDDFVSLFAKLYKKYTGKTLFSQDILGLSSEDGFMTKGMLQNASNTSKNIEFISINGNPNDRLIRSESAYYLVRMFDIPVLAFDKQSSLPIAEVFTDISGHSFASEISILAKFGIVNTQTPKFYPDNHLRHYDFLVLFINALLAYKDESLSSDAHISYFADVGTSASYLSQLNYAADRGLIDPLVTSIQGQLYFNPNDFMTKDAVYRMLSKALNIQFVYDKAQVITEKITRAELAKLLVDSLQFDIKKTSESEPSSGTPPEDISLITKFKTLLSMM